jgi:hypothetical protein
MKIKMIIMNTILEPYPSLNPAAAADSLEKFPAIYGCGIFIVVLTTACHWSPSRAR